MYKRVKQLTETQKNQSVIRLQGQKKPSQVFSEHSSHLSRALTEHFDSNVFLW